MRNLPERLRGYEPLFSAWRVARQIYAGGGSSVFLLERARFDKPLLCTLKVIEILSDDRDALAAGLAAALDEIERMELLSGCENIVSVLDDQIFEIRDESGKLSGYDVLVRMESLACLADLMREGEVFSENEVIKLGLDLCRALSYAHERGVLHRDVKPGNIYRTASGRYKLGDFGASAHVPDDGRHRMTVTGTMAYMAPEMAKGKPYGKQADLYSLGVTLYQLLNENFLPLTGARSTYSQREEAIKSRWNGASLPPPKTGGAFLRETVLRACAADPARRFLSAADLAEALGSPPQKKKRRLSGRLFALCALMLTLGFSAAFLFFHLKESDPPAVSIYPPDENLPRETVTVSAYEVVARNMTWEDAKVYCESRGGHLATVTSRKEEAEVIRLLEEKGVQAAWIGANNRNSSKGFSWITGERFSYAAWGINEPNNTNDVEHYLMLMQSAEQGWIWNDSKDSGLDLFIQGKVGFVCEWDEEETP